MGRQKEVSLTKTKKKGKEAKGKTIELVRELLKQYQYCYVLRFSNQRNQDLKVVREKLKPARLVYGKNKVLQLALGKSQADEVAKLSHRISKTLVGNRGLLFSDDSISNIQEFFASFRPTTYARCGCVAPTTIHIEEGFGALEGLPASLELTFRDLGLPTRLVEGKIEVLGSTTVCEEGKQISAKQAQILKLLGHRLSNFEVDVEHVWSSAGFKTLMSE